VLKSGRVFERLTAGEKLILFRFMDLYKFFAFIICLMCIDRFMRLALRFKMSLCFLGYFSFRRMFGSRVLVVFHTLCLLSLLIVAFHRVFVFPSFSCFSAVLFASRLPLASSNIAVI